MPDKTQEDRIRLAAARSGLKLIINKYGLASTGTKTYCLRPMWDATRVVGTLPDGEFGLVKATSKGKRRQKVASWLPLNAIERMLPDLRGVRRLRIVAAKLVHKRVGGQSSPSRSMASSAAVAPSMTCSV